MRKRGVLRDFSIKFIAILIILIILASPIRFVNAESSGLDCQTLDLISKNIKDKIQLALVNQMPFSEIKKQLAADDAFTEIESERVIEGVKQDYKQAITLQNPELIRVLGFANTVEITQGTSINPEQIAKVILDAQKKESQIETIATQDLLSAFSAQEMYDLIKDTQLARTPREREFFEFYNDIYKIKIAEQPISALNELNDLLHERQLNDQQYNELLQPILAEENTQEFKEQTANEILARLQEEQDIGKRKILRAGYSQAVAGIEDLSRRKELLNILGDQAFRLELLQIFDQYDRDVKNNNGNKHTETKEHLEKYDDFIEEFKLRSIQILFPKYDKTQTEIILKALVTIRPWDDKALAVEGEQAKRILSELKDPEFQEEMKLFYRSLEAYSFSLQDLMQNIDSAKLFNSHVVMNRLGSVYFSLLLAGIDVPETASGLKELNKDNILEVKYTFIDQGKKGEGIKAVAGINSDGNTLITIFSKNNPTGNHLQRMAEINPGFEQLDLKSYDYENSRKVLLEDLRDRKLKIDDVSNFLGFEIQLNDNGDIKSIKISSQIDDFITKNNLPITQSRAEELTFKLIEAIDPNLFAPEFIGVTIEHQELKNVVDENIIREKSLALLEQRKAAEQPKESALETIADTADIAEEPADLLSDASRLTPLSLEERTRFEYLATAIAQEEYSDFEERDEFEELSQRLAQSDNEQDKELYYRATESRIGELLKVAGISTFEIPNQMLEYRRQMSRYGWDEHLNLMQAEILRLQGILELDGKKLDKNQIASMLLAVEVHDFGKVFSLEDRLRQLDPNADVPENFNALAEFVARKSTSGKTLGEILNTVVVKNGENQRVFSESETREILRTFESFRKYLKENPQDIKELKDREIITEGGEKVILSETQLVDDMPARDMYQLHMAYLSDMLALSQNERQNDISAKAMSFIVDGQDVTNDVVAGAVGHHTLQEYGSPSDQQFRNLGIENLQTKEDVKSNKVSQTMNVVDIYQAATSLTRLPAGVNPNTRTPEKAIAIVLINLKNSKNTGSYNIEAARALVNGEVRGQEEKQKLLSDLNILEAEVRLRTSPEVNAWINNNELSTKILLEATKDLNEQTRSLIVSTAIATKLEKLNNPDKVKLTRNAIAELKNAGIEGLRVNEYVLVLKIIKDGKTAVLKISNNALQKESQNLKIAGQIISNLIDKGQEGIKAPPKVLAVLGDNAYVQEFVDAQDIDDFVQNSGELHPEALTGFEAMVNALHENGFVHRDLNPGNIKVEKDGTIRLIDFGEGGSRELIEKKGLSFEAAIKLDQESVVSIKNKYSGSSQPDLNENLIETNVGNQAEQQNPEGITAVPVIPTTAVKILRAFTRIAVITGVLYAADLFLTGGTGGMLTAGIPGFFNFGGPSIQLDVRRGSAIAKVLDEKKFLQNPSKFQRVQLNPNPEYQVNGYRVVVGNFKGEEYFVFQEKESGKFHLVKATNEVKLKVAEEKALRELAKINVKSQELEILAEDLNHGLRNGYESDAYTQSLSPRAREINSIMEPIIRDAGLYGLSEISLSLKSQLPSRTSEESKNLPIEQLSTVEIFSKLNGDNGQDVKLLVELMKNKGNSETKLYAIGQERVTYQEINDAIINFRNLARRDSFVLKLEMQRIIGLVDEQRKQQYQESMQKLLEIAGVSIQNQNSDVPAYQNAQDLAVQAVLHELDICRAK